jgi:medium-chain acyl-[acyl-carrier-protein] hydrolase
VNERNECLVKIESTADNGRVVICIPQAGAGVGSLVPLAQSLRDRASVWVARFPGRENRILEPPLRSIGDMAYSLMPPVKSINAESMVLFGHCSGALVAYELAHLLSGEARNWSDTWLAVSGQPAPGAEQQSREACALHERGLADELRDLGGTPEEILNNADLLEMLAPMIEADFAAVDSYHFQKGRARLAIPIAALGGRDDESVPESDLLAWRDHTISQFRYDLFDGDHFYLPQQITAVSQVLLSLTCPDEA